MVVDCNEQLAESDRNSRIPRFPAESEYDTDKPAKTQSSLIYGLESLQRFFWPMNLPCFACCVPKPAAVAHGGVWGLKAAAEKGIRCQGCQVLFHGKQPSTRKFSVFTEKQLPEL